MKRPLLNRDVRRALGFRGQARLVDPTVQDSVGVGAQLEAKPLHRMNFDVKLKISATCTVIKNEGRPDEQIICEKKHNVLRNGGRDHIHNLMFVNAATSAAGHRSINWIGLSTDATAPSASTAVGTTTGLINDFGLHPAEATTRTDNGYTGATCVQTLTKVFTAPIVKAGIRKTYLMSRIPPTGALSSWVVVHEVQMPVVNMGVGDTLTLTWVITVDRQLTGNIVMINAVGTYTGGLGEIIGRLYRELQSEQIHGSAQYGINNIGLSTSNAAVTATATSLPDILGAGGLGRANGTVAHTAGTNITTITNTFTTVAAQANIRKSGLYSSSVSGHSSMYFYGNFSSAKSLQANDSITVTWTMTVEA